MKTEEEKLEISKPYYPEVMDKEWVSTQEFDSDIRWREALRLFALVPLVVFLGHFGMCLGTGIGTLLNQPLSESPPMTAAEEIRFMGLLNEYWDFEEVKKDPDYLLSDTIIIKPQIERLKKYGGSAADLARWEGYHREIQAEWDKIYAEMPSLREAFRIISPQLPPRLREKGTGSPDER